MNLPFKPSKILAVDDEADICELLKEALVQAGYACHAANSAEAALGRLEREHFDAVVSDLHLGGGMDGLHFMQAALERWPHLVFLLVTAEDDVRTGIEAMKRGAADYLIKPFQIANVVSAVGWALERKRMQLELDRYRDHLEIMVRERTAMLQSALLKIENSYNQTLAVLGAALDLRDDETGGHALRVSRYFITLAEAVKFPSEQLPDAIRGAYLHDIGKLAIPDAILLKPGPLSAEEAGIMQTHVAIGYEMVRQIAFLEPAAELILSHHERFDGSGYPRGLLGDDIPLSARIFSVADALDAMTSNRPYRPSLGFESALREIRNQSGRQFDPAVVQAFVHLPAALWPDIRNGRVKTGESFLSELLSTGLREAAARTLTVKFSSASGRRAAGR